MESTRLVNPALDGKEGWYDYNNHYIDMDGYYSLLFANLHKPHSKNLYDCMVTGKVLCTAKHTITGIWLADDSQGSRDRDAYHHFFPYTSWMTSEL